MRWFWTWRYLAQGAGRDIRRHAARSVLAVCCVSLGAAGTITSASYVHAGRERLLGQIQQLGTNVIVVLPKQNRNAGSRARAGQPARTLRPDDYRAIRARVGTAVRASALSSVAGRLYARGFTKNAAVIGCELDYFAIKTWALVAGGLFDQSDVRRSARVAVLGYGTATDLFGTTAVIGQRFLINRVPFQIVGVLAERGSGRDLSDEDRQVYVPLGTAMRRLQNVEDLSGAVLEVADSAALGAAMIQVSGILADRHRSSPTRPPDFDVQNQQALIDEQLAASDRLLLFVRWINVSALAMAGCGVLAILWITVHHRITEIGTRRAVGATSGDVFLQFALEAVLISMAGCALGIALGWSATRVVLTLAQLPLPFDLPAAVSAALSSGGLSLLFGAVPAWRAARLNPALALASS